MMYNKYRKYNTLNGIKKDNKMDIVNKLTPITKNVVNLIPKDQYDQFIKGHLKITYRLVVDTNNRIKNVSLCAWDNQDGYYVMTAKKDIPIPNLCYFRGIYDSSRYLPDNLNVEFHNSSGQFLNVDPSPIYSPNYTAPDIDPTYGLNGSFFSMITEFPLAYHLTMNKTYREDKYYDASYDISCPKTFSFMIIDLTVTNQTYEKLPSIPITTFD